MDDRNSKYYDKIRRQNCERIDFLVERASQLQSCKGLQPLRAKFPQQKYMDNPPSSPKTAFKLPALSRTAKQRYSTQAHLPEQISRQSTSKQDICALFRKLRQHTCSSHSIEQYIFSKRYLSKSENSAFFDKSTELQLIKDNLKITTYINKLRSLNSSKFNI